MMHIQHWKGVLCPEEAEFCNSAPHQLFALEKLYHLHNSLHVHGNGC